MKKIRVFCPATIANISCGFDVLGACLEAVGDEIEIVEVPEKGIRIRAIEGADLPLEIEKNVAGVAALALLKALTKPLDYGFEIVLRKRIKAGSGIGSSAASAAGTVFALNALLGNPFSTISLIRFAMEGERLACGTAHADNVAPALLGGFTVVRSYHPLDVVKIQAPEQLFAVVIHPQIELRTADARAILRKQITLKQATVQSGNLAGLICGLYTHDYELIGRSLNDEIIEPVRSILIPGFLKMKLAALQAGALGSGISGSGPSVFALCKTEESAIVVAKAMAEELDAIHIPYEVHVSKINDEGVKILGDEIS